MTCDLRFYGSDVLANDSGVPSQQLWKIRRLRQTSEREGGSAMRLDRAKFLAWLKQKKPTEIVGENRDGCACPLANFYADASGGSEVAIFERWGAYYIDRGYDKRRLPGWAELFVIDVDDDESPQVSAARAIEILTAR